MYVIWAEWRPGAGNPFYVAAIILNHNARRAYYFEKRAHAVWLAALNSWLVEFSFKNVPSEGHFIWKQLKW